MEHVWQRQSGSQLILYLKIQIIESQVTTREIPFAPLQQNIATLLLEPVTKNVPVKTLNISVIPPKEKENVEIYSISKDFDTDQNYKRWFEKSPLPFAPASEDRKKASTRYIVGKNESDTQIMIRVNSSFRNAYTSNSSGYIDFVYDGYEERSTSGGEVEVNEDLQSYKVLKFELRKVIAQL